MRAFYRKYGICSLSWQHKESMLQSLRRHHKNNADRDKKSIKKGFFFFFYKKSLNSKSGKEQYKPETKHKKQVNREVADCTTVRSTKHSSQFHRASFTTGSKAHSNMLLCKRYTWKKDWGKRKLSIHKTLFKCGTQVSSPKVNTTWSNETIGASLVSTNVKWGFYTLGSKTEISKTNKCKNQN